MGDGADDGETDGHGLVVGDGICEGAGESEGVGVGVGVGGGLCPPSNCKSNSIKWSKNWKNFCNHPRRPIICFLVLLLIMLVWATQGFVVGEGDVAEGEG